MNGIFGIIRSDGRKVETAELHAAAERFTLPAPRPSNLWHSGNVGLLAGGSDANRDCTALAEVDGVCVVADARIDGREELLARIGGGAELAAASDAELILAAYRRFGTRTAEYLLGDFAFALWDSHQALLYCARDPFGVQPFYFRQQGDGLFFANEIPCLQYAVADGTAELDPSAVLDFLVVGLRQDGASTFYKDIRRLSAAHSMVVTAGGRLQQRRYWRPDPQAMLKLSPRESVETFRHAMAAAVRDRARGERVAVWLSGGMDSAIVAAVAAEELGRDNVMGFTYGSRELLPDREPEFAAETARFLGIRHRVLDADRYALFGESERHAANWPEPVDMPLPALWADFCAASSRFSTVCLTGQGGDPLLLPSAAEVAGQVRRCDPTLVSAFAAHMVRYRRIPRVGWRTMRRKRSASPPPSIPPWIRPEWHGAARERAEIAWQVSAVGLARPDAIWSLASPVWEQLWECNRPAYTGQALEVRHPFFDLRVVSLLLALPTLPWCVDKHLLRLAGHGRLPGRVLRRPKSPVRRDPTHAAILDGRVAPFVRGIGQGCAEFVNPAAMPGRFAADAQTNWFLVRTMLLDQWLRAMTTIAATREATA